VPDYEDIYDNGADTYQRLVAREDYENNLLRTVGELYPLSPRLTVADLGAGTGRVSFLLAGSVGHVHAMEPSRGMRDRALREKSSRNAVNVDLIDGDHRRIPLPDRSVDMVIEGWSFAYVFSRSQPDWKPVVDAMIAEAWRIAKPGGIVILIETLGTMKECPAPPAGLLPFYDYLETVHGFLKKSIRTDYRFDSPGEAVELVTFFFGDEMGREAKDRNDAVVPECTGVWYQYR
jgi:ubiquinone/menaquinone biosynthesis C-methylase UbiE